MIAGHTGYDTVEKFKSLSPKQISNIYSGILKMKEIDTAIWANHSMAMKGIKHRLETPAIFETITEEGNSIPKIFMESIQNEINRIKSSG